MTGFASVLKALVLRPLVREKLRALLTILGVAVGVAVLVAIELSNQSAIQSFESSVDAVAGRANYQIVSEAAPLDENILLALQPLWREGGRFAPVIDVEGTYEPSGIPIRILGVDLLSDLHFRDYRYARISQSSMPAARDAGVGEATAAFLELFREDSIVVPEAFAKQHGLKLGSGVELEYLGRRVRFVVRGILQPVGPATAFNGSIAILDISSAQRALGLTGKISRVDLLVPDAAARTLARIAQKLPGQARLERPSRRNERVGKMLRAFKVNLFALAAVALLVGIFLVYNTVLISILRRRRAIGILRTLGVGRGHLLAAFVGEGLVFGLAGSALGVGLGLVLARGILGAISKTINALYVTTDPRDVRLTAGLVATGFAIGVLSAVAAALQPALEASATEPISLVRPGIYQRVGGASARKLSLAALACFVLAAVSTLAPPVDGVSVGGYASVLFVIGGSSLLCPFVLAWVSRSLRAPLERLFSVSGNLAGASIPASLRRISVATAALSVAIGMMVAVTLMVGSFRETVNAWVAQTVKSDLWLRPASNLSNQQVAVFPPQIAAELDRIDFVAAYDRFRGRTIVFHDTNILVGSGDFRTAIEHSSLPMVKPGSQDRALRDAIARGGVLISETLAYKFGFSVGDSIELPTAAGLHRFPISGIYRDYSNDRGVVVMDRAVWIDKFRDDSINTVAIFLKDGVDPEWARTELETRLGRRFRVFAITNASIRREVMRIFDQTFMVTWALLGVSLVVAVLGIVNTLSALIIERRAEVALLKVLGVSRGQITAMLTIESALVGISSTIIGLASGWVLATILIYVINRQSFGWTIEFAPPAGIVAISLGVTLIATTLAGLIPSGFADRVVMAREIKSE